MPPDAYSSTGIAEQSIRKQSLRGCIYHTGTKSSWKTVPYENLLTLLTKSDTPMLELIHMNDTGAHPEYMENMSSSCHLFVFVIDLQYDIDEHPSIGYEREYKQFQYSNRQMIQKLAATFHTKIISEVGKTFRLVVVGTHTDCVEPSILGSRIRAYHQALSSILLPSCETALILFSADEIPFVLNLKMPSKDDLAKLDLIREIVNKSEVGEILNIPGVLFCI